MEKINDNGCREFAANVSMCGVVLMLNLLPPRNIKMRYYLSIGYIILNVQNINYLNAHNSGYEDDSKPAMFE